MRVWNESVVHPTSASISDSHFFGFPLAPLLFVNPLLNDVVCLQGSSFPWFPLLSAP